MGGFTLLRLLFLIVELPSSVVQYRYHNRPQINDYYNKKLDRAMFVVPIARLYRALSRLLTESRRRAGLLLR